MDFSRLDWLCVKQRNFTYYPGMTMSSPNIFFSVGEPSGDLHAAKLISALKKLHPRASFRGFGGARMLDAGCSLDYELTNLAVVGFV